MTSNQSSNEGGGAEGLKGENSFNTRLILLRRKLSFISLISLLSSNLPDSDHSGLESKIKQSKQMISFSYFKIKVDKCINFFSCVIHFLKVVHF